MRLCGLDVGQKAKILTVEGEENLRGHLLDMGLIPGTTVEVRKMAPMGDPMQLMLRGYELTLRKDDCENITIEVIE